MSDQYVTADDVWILEPAVEETPEEVPKTIQNGKVVTKQPCPDCGNLYFPGPGMTRHRQTLHGMPSKNKIGGFVGRKATCKLCHKTLDASNLQRHMNRMHPGKVVKEPSPPKVTRSPLPKQVTAEEITRTAAAMLWPDGVPHAVLPQLLIWNTQTEQFLHSVS